MDDVRLDKLIKKWYRLTSQLDLFNHRVMIWFFS